MLRNPHALRRHTDAVSAVLAESVDADRLIYATSTPAVSTADPNTCPDTEWFHELIPGRLVSPLLDTDVTARSRVPIDAGGGDGTAATVT
ncbi:hypothetical protein [Haloarchaeobius sp. DYHT-AS-18]|uniref:amino acid kinase family protein n=1 Tax=Haloarchaeobius sp. DYHT-AS-18 TaxID=3446117 RepID=UPI003EB990C6